MNRRVCIVGRGRMAGAFAKAFRNAGVPHRVIASRRQTPTTKRSQGSRVAAITWLLAVPDSAIGPTAEKLVREGHVGPRDAMVHLAGMLDASVLHPVRATGAAIGALHPWLAVSTAKRPPDVRHSVAAFEGDPACLAAVRAFARPIGLTVLSLQIVHRDGYHAAAALVATGAVALAQGATELLKHATLGTSEKHVRALLRSILVSVAHNVYVSGAQGALASPLMRGDTRAIDRHFGALRGHADAARLYDAALRQAIATLQRAGLVDRGVLRAAKSIVSRRTA